MLRTVATVGAVLVAAPALANGMNDEFFERIGLTLILYVILFVVTLVVSVFLFARLVGLEGGFLKALLAVALAVFNGLVLGFIIAIMAAFFPRSFMQPMVSAATILGGAVAVKLVFGTDMGHGLLVYLLATIASYVVLMIGVIIAF